MERRKNESWKKEEENGKEENESWKKEEENGKEEQEQGNEKIGKWKEIKKWEETKKMGKNKKKSNFLSEIAQLRCVRDSNS